MLLKIVYLLIRRLRGRQRGRPVVAGPARGLRPRRPGPLRTNIRGTFVVDQQAARRVRPGGAIINFSSSVLGRVLPTYTGYAASKAAVEAMTFTAAVAIAAQVAPIPPCWPPRPLAGRDLSPYPGSG